MKFWSNSIMMMHGVLAVHKRSTFLMISLLALAFWDLIQAHCDLSLCKLFYFVECVYNIFHDKFWSDTGPIYFWENISCFSFRVLTFNFFHFVFLLLITKRSQKMKIENVIVKLNRPVVVATWCFFHFVFVCLPQGLWMEFHVQPALLLAFHRHLHCFLAYILFFRVKLDSYFVAASAWKIKWKLFYEESWN